MKALFFLTNASNRGGTERTCFLICNELSKNGYEVHLFCISGQSDNLAYQLDDKVHVHILNIEFNGIKLFLRLPYILFTLRQYILDHGIRFLIGVEAMSCLFTLPILPFVDRRKLKLILWEHFNFTVNLGIKSRDFCRRLAAKYADAVVTLTSKDREMWLENLKPSAKLFTINNPSPFSTSKNSYPINSCDIIAVGRITHQKGFDMLVRSWKLAEERIKQLPGNWRLSIIGDGEDKGELKELINYLELNESIELVSNKSNIGSYYETAAFLCMTSRYEGLPMVLIEAQSYGLPIIAFDCLTGPAEIVDLESGTLCSTFDIASFSDVIVEFAGDINKRKAMSERAKILASRFHSDHIMGNWQNMLESL